VTRLPSACLELRPKNLRREVPSHDRSNGKGQGHSPLRLCTIHRFLIAGISIDCGVAGQTFLVRNGQLRQQLQKLADVMDPWKVDRMQDQ
jgi:hypothetical protein